MSGILAGRGYELITDSVSRCGLVSEVDYLFAIATDIHMHKLKDNLVAVKITNSPQPNN